MNLRSLLALGVLLQVFGCCHAGETTSDVHIRQLVQQLKAPEQETREAATATLVRIGTPAVNALIDCLQRGGETLGSPAAARALGRIRDRSAVPALIEALKSPGSVGSEAAWALGEIGDPRAVEPLLNSVDIWGNTAVFVALGKFKDSRAVEPLVKQLNSENPPVVREAAAMALGMLADKKATGALVGLLSDNDREVKMQAVKALGKIGDVRAVAPLLAILQDKTIGIRDAAIMALGTIGDRRAVAPLTELLDDSSVGWRAAEALGAIGDPEAIEPLALYLERTTRRARRSGEKGAGTIWCVARALAALDHARAVAVLQKLYLDEDEPLRGEIHTVLQELRRADRTKGAEWGAPVE